MQWECMIVFEWKDFLLEKLKSLLIILASGNLFLCYGGIILLVEQSIYVSHQFFSLEYLSEGALLQDIFYNIFLYENYQIFRFWCK